MASFGGFFFLFLICLPEIDRNASWLPHLLTCVTLLTMQTSFCISHNKAVPCNWQTHKAFIKCQLSIFHIFFKNHKPQNLKTPRQPKGPKRPQYRNNRVWSQASAGKYKHECDEVVHSGKSHDCFEHYRRCPQWHCLECPLRKIAWERRVKHCCVRLFWAAESQSVSI